MIRRNLIAAAAALMGLGAGTTTAIADDVQCGAVLTQDTTLTHDLTGCMGHGLVAAAPGITVDLGGHTITSARGNVIGGGLVDDRGHDGVTFRNGTIRGFRFGVLIGGGADEVTVRDVGTAGASYSGVYLRESLGGRVSDVEVDARGSVQGIVLQQMHGATVHHARVHGSQNGGIVVFGGRGNTIAHNRADDNRNEGIFLGFLGGAKDTLVSNNRTSRNGTGIHVFGDNGGSVIVGNHMDRNRENGYFAQDSPGGVSLGGNHARFNGDYGLLAAAGDIDLGRNKAHHNGIADCVNLACGR